MTLDLETRQAIAHLPYSPTILEAWDNIAERLSDAFTWSGSKIDWGTTAHHQFIKLEGDLSDWAASAVTFAQRNLGTQAECLEHPLYYLNDSALDFAVMVSAEGLWDFMAFIVANVPQHHYFFDHAARWCVVVSAEGYADFGLSTK